MIVSIPFDKFGDALNNSEEITKYMDIIKLDLLLDWTESNQSDKDKFSNINVLDIINNVESTEKYILPKRNTDSNNTKKMTLNTDKTTTIKVSNISQDITDTDLKTLFEEFGDIRRMHIPKGKKSKESLGYAFITYNQRAEAQTAINKMNKHAYEYCILDITWAK